MVSKVFIKQTETVAIMHLSMLSPRRGGGGTPGICGAFDFSEEFLIKIPTVGFQNLVKSDQIYPTFLHLIF